MTSRENQWAPPLRLILLLLLFLYSNTATSNKLAIVSVLRLIVGVTLTHSQRNAASSKDLSVVIPDAFAGVLQVKQIHVDITNISHHDGLERSCSGATVVSSQHCRFYSDLPGAKPAL